jgi:hypothetical protein
MSTLTTSARSTEGPRAWHRIRVAVALSILAGIPVLFLVIERGFIGGGDEGRWQPYTAGMGLLYAALVFAYTFPATRRHWGDFNGAVASVLTGIVGCFGIFLGSLGTLIVALVLGGYGEG